MAFELFLLAVLIDKFNSKYQIDKFTGVLIADKKTSLINEINQMSIDEIKNLINEFIKEMGQEDVYLKKGKFGYYLECGKILKSLQTIKINVPLKNIELNDAISILQDIDAGNNSLQRRINENISIRKGKYGDYIFYKTDKMYKPKFYKLNGFRDDYKSCEIDKLYNWIKETFDIK